MEEIKLRKIMNKFELKLVQIYSLVYVIFFSFLFFPFPQTKYTIKE
jgi:hypothetical protein